MVDPFSKYEPRFIEALLRFGPPPRTGWKAWRIQVREGYRYRYRWASQSIRRDNWAYTKRVRNFLLCDLPHDYRVNILAMFMYWWKLQCKKRET